MFSNNNRILSTPDATAHARKYAVLNEGVDIYGIWGSSSIGSVLPVTAPAEPRDCPKPLHESEDIHILYSPNAISW